MVRALLATDAPITMDLHGTAFKERDGSHRTSILAGGVNTMDAGLGDLPAADPEAGVGSVEARPISVCLGAGPHTLITTRAPVHVDYQ